MGKKLYPPRTRMVKTVDLLPGDVFEGDQQIVVEVLPDPVTDPKQILFPATIEPASWHMVMRAVEGLVLGIALESEQLHMIRRYATAETPFDLEDAISRSKLRSPHDRYLSPSSDAPEPGL